MCGASPASRSSPARLFERREATIDNLRLWDYRPLLTTFGQQQILRRYYTFTDVDIDRYQVSDEQRQIMLSARELDVELFGDEPDLDQRAAGLHPRLRHHGGAGRRGHRRRARRTTSSAASTPSPQLPIGEPRIYFGEATDTYVVTGTDDRRVRPPARHRCERRGRHDDRLERRRPGSGSTTSSSRALFALRFGDFNLLISGQLTDDSQILFRRDIEERVHEIAPFLAYDHDPYLVSAPTTGCCG